MNVSICIYLDVINLPTPHSTSDIAPPDPSIGRSVLNIYLKINCLYLYNTFTHNSLPFLHQIFFCGFYVKTEHSSRDLFMIRNDCCIFTTSCKYTGTYIPSLNCFGVN